MAIKTAAGRAAAVRTATGMAAASRSRAEAPSSGAALAPTTAPVLPRPPAVDLVPDPVPHRPPAPPPTPAVQESPPSGPTVTAVTGPPPGDGDRRNLLLAALVIIAVAGVLGLVALVATVLSGTPSPDSITQPSATSGGGTQPSGSPGATPPEAGPGGPPDDGLVVDAVLVSATTIEIVETIRWPDGGPAPIELELLPGLAAASGLTVEATPTVEALQVSVDGSAVTPVRREGARNAWLVTPPSGAAPQFLEIRYLLQGAILRSEPAVPGRALAVLTPITFGAVVDLPITIHIAGTGVLNVYCPTAPTPAALNCGRLDAGRWTVTPPPGRPFVIAQLDLPPPS